MICYPWLSPARVLDHGAKRGSSLLLLAATRDEADKGFVPSGTLVVDRLRSEQDRMLQRWWSTYRPGVRPTVIAALDLGSLPIVLPVSASVGIGWIGRPSGRPILQTKQFRGLSLSGLDNVAWMVCRSSVICERWPSGLFTGHRAPNGNGRPSG
jgi:hypothetical protein